MLSADTVTEGFEYCNEHHNMVIMTLNSTRQQLTSF